MFESTKERKSKLAKAGTKATGLGIKAKLAKPSDSKKNPDLLALEQKRDILEEYIGTPKTTYPFLLSLP